MQPEFFLRREFVWDSFPPSCLLLPAIHLSVMAIEDRLGWDARLFLLHLLQIPDEFEGHPLNMFCLPHHYEDKVESVLIPKGIIMDR